MTSTEYDRTHRFEWVKISRKDTARKMWEKGEVDVYVLPNKMIPDNMWQSPSMIPTDEYYTFDSFCNSYMYYNCNSELGKTLAFYTKKYY